MQLYAIRGATTVGSDSLDEIRCASVELIQAIVETNGIKPEETVSLIATSTSDIRAAYPVKFMRESGIIGDTPVFSACEPDIAGGLPLCIRVLWHIQKDDVDFKPKHVYLRGARTLITKN